MLDARRAAAERVLEEEAARLRQIEARIAQLDGGGDAELDEGSNHEAVEIAAALELEALTVVVVDNRSSSYAVPGRIEERFATEGWHTVGVDGRDHARLHQVPHASQFFLSHQTARLIFLYPRLRNIALSRPHKI